MRKHLKKIVISIMLVLTVNFITPPASHAWDVGGILIKPISSLIAAVFDVTNGVMTYFIVGISNGFVSWGGDSFQEFVDGISDENNYADMKDENDNLILKAKEIDDRIEDAVATFGSSVASILVSMEDFFLGKINLANINIFKEMPEESVFSYINQFLRNYRNRK
ncbi:MAG TPA: hypothetical protein DCE23_02505 [Firmicutes bacterium]|nr:hypothetical protein [Bacillota bacterium]